MVRHMKTTLNIDDSVMQRLREESARRGTTMSALVEAGLRRILDEPSTSEFERADLPPLPSWDGGRELIEVADREELHQVLDADSARERLYRA